MANTDISKEEIQAVFPKVAETMADALGCDVEDVKLDVSLIEGLDARTRAATCPKRSLSRKAY